LPYEADKFDWRNLNGENLVTDVRDQNAPQKCRTFETFAAVAAMESLMLRKYPQLDRDTLDLSEQDFNNCWVNDQCKQASYPEIFFDSVTCEGAAFESQVPYTGKDAPGTKDCATKLDRYDTGIRAWSYVAGNEANMTQAINFAPIANELRVNSWMMQLYDAGVFDCLYAAPPVFPQPGNDTDVALYFAATTLVAFENSVVVTPVNQTSQATWNVWAGKMSLGKGWGDNGYIRLRKDCSGDGARGALNMYTSKANFRVLPILEDQPGAPSPPSPGLPQPPAGPSHSPSPSPEPSPSPSPEPSPSPSPEPSPSPSPEPSPSPSPEPSPSPSPEPSPSPSPEPSPSPSPEPSPSPSPEPSPSPSPEPSPSPSPEPSPSPSPEPSPSPSPEPSPSPSPSPPPTPLVCFDRVEALSKDATGCDGALVDSVELWAGPPGMTVPTTSKPYGPGKSFVTIVTSSDPVVSCVASVTVLPCKPACVAGTRVAVPLDTCAITDVPAGLLDQSTVSNLVAATEKTTSPDPPFRVGRWSTVFTLTYPGDVSVTSDKCAFTVLDTQKPQVVAKPVCIQPKNADNTFGAPSYCFSSAQLASGTDNCITPRYTIGSCRNLRPLLGITAARPCFFGPTLACIDIRKSFPAPSDVTKPRTLQVILTASDSSSNKVSITSYIDIYFQPKDGCVFV
jgi:hypothetical protein